MDVAVSGDRSSCLTAEFAPGTYLFAVANGFGAIDGVPVAPAMLERFRAECERRTRGRRLQRSQRRSRGLASTLTAAMTRINAELHARSASNDDRVTAGCSMTGVLLLGDRAYLAHVGSTAAYLARDGYVVSLTKNDAFEAEGLPVLTRALGLAPALELATCSFTMNEGDALVLAGRRLREADERRRLTDHLTGFAHGVGEQLVIARYTPPDAPHCHGSASAGSPHNIVTGVLATLFFYAMLCIR